MNDSPPITGLYVPGHRPDRFERALTSGADLVILDLEDAVPAEQKASARAAVAAVLAEREPASAPIVQVRVNAGEMLADDLAALTPLPATRFEVRLPKVEAAADVDRLVALLGGASAPGSVSVTAIVETALGLERCFEIASHPAVTRVAIGESDLASDLGSRHPDVIGHARNLVLFAARAAGLSAPMMSAYPDIRDTAGLRADTVEGAARGWVGRVAIHPAQLPVIASAFRPEPAELAWAQQVLEAMRGGGVTTLPNGEMVDAAMTGRARSILARDRAAEAAVTPPPPATAP